MTASGFRISKEEWMPCYLHAINFLGSVASSRAVEGQGPLSLNSAYKYLSITRKGIGAVEESQRFELREVAQVGVKLPHEDVCESALWIVELEFFEVNEGSDEGHRLVDVFSLSAGPKESREVE